MEEKKNAQSMLKRATWLITAKRPRVNQKEQKTKKNSNCVYKHMEKKCRILCLSFFLKHLSKIEIITRD